jgi:hypothetical protein
MVLKRKMASNYIKISIITLSLLTIMGQHFCFGQTPELACIKKVNCFLFKIIKELDSLKAMDLNAVKFIVGLKLSERGEASLIEIKRSNLEDFGIDSQDVVTRLKKVRLKCLYKTYYTNSKKPDKVYFHYNQKICLCCG